MKGQEVDPQAHTRHYARQGSTAHGAPRTTHDTGFSGTIATLAVLDRTGRFHFSRLLFPRLFGSSALEFHFDPWVVQAVYDLVGGVYFVSLPVAYVAAVVAVLYLAAVIAVVYLAAVTAVAVVAVVAAVVRVLVTTCTVTDEMFPYRW